MKMPYVVGLTGGIGSGKTVVSDYFAEIGVPVIDTDVIARLMVQPGQSALVQLVEVFGEQILQDDGNLNRDALRQLAFANQQNKAQLDAITHPAIWQETIKQVESVDFPYCIVVVPLLRPDSRFEALMQRVLVVTAEHQTKIERVKRRSNLSVAEVEKIMATQLSDAEREEFSDDIIANDGSIADAQQAAQQLHEQYLELSLERG